MTPPDQGDAIRVVGIVGSLRRDSHTRKVVRVALDGAAQAGCDTELIDLRDYDLVFCDGDEPDGGYGGDVGRLRTKVGAAHGIILGSPEYHGSFSGVLKNALDLMGFDEFEGKIVGLVGVSGGRLGGTNAMQGLRNVGRSLHAWVIPIEAGVPQAHKAFDAAGNLADERMAERVRDVGRGVARFAFLHHSEEIRAFVDEWEQCVENPGG